jgi:hypothetical protein
MDRRAFIKGLLATGLLAAVDPEPLIENLLQDTKHFSDDDFIFYINASFNLHVSNPSSCGIITGIVEG